MSLALYSQVVLTRDVPEEGLRAGDMGTLVLEHSGPDGRVVGYELEVFAATGETLCVASVPVEAVRPVQSSDCLAVREVPSSVWSSAPGFENATPGVPSAAPPLP
jgi:hypothetical protein